MRTLPLRGRRQARRDLGCRAASSRLGTTSRFAVAALGAVVLIGATGSSGAAELHVAAAASLSDAIAEASHAWEAQGDRVLLDLAASSTLARQIVEGAPVDLFFSADEAQMDRVERAGRLLAGSRRTLLENSLVVVVPGDREGGPADARALASPEVHRLALADPAVVPAGVYARDWLTRLGLWEEVAPKVVPLENVRAALAAVESGNVDAAIVYATDAALAHRSRIAFRVTGEAAPRIRYPVAVIAGSASPAAASRFADFLASPAATRIFERWGFRPER